MLNNTLGDNNINIKRLLQYSVSIVGAYTATQFSTLMVSGKARVLKGFPKVKHLK